MITFTLCFGVLQPKKGEGDKWRKMLKFCGKTKANMSMVLPRVNGQQSKYMQLFLISIQQNLCIFLEVQQIQEWEGLYSIACEHRDGWTDIAGASISTMVEKTIKVSALY